MNVEVNEEGQLKVVFDEELEKFRKELSAERNKMNSFFNQRKYKFENELTKIEENAYKNFLKDEKLKGIAEEVFGKYITKFIREMFGENVGDNAIAQMIETLGWEMKSIRERKKNKSSKDDWYI